jgi:hypothetical protein
MHQPTLPGVLIDSIQNWLGFISAPTPLFFVRTSTKKNPTTAMTTRLLSGTWLCFQTQDARSGMGMGWLRSSASIVLAALKEPAPVPELEPAPVPAPVPVPVSVPVSGASGASDAMRSSSTKATTSLRTGSRSGGEFIHKLEFGDQDYFNVVFNKFPALVCSVFQFWLLPFIKKNGTM